MTVKAAVYDGALEVKQDRMKPIDSQQTQAEIEEIYKRIERLQQVGSLDREADYVLAGIAKQTYLTEVGENYLHAWRSITKSNEISCFSKESEHSPVI